MPNTHSGQTAISYSMLFGGTQSEKGQTRDNPWTAIPFMGTVLLVIVQVTDSIRALSANTENPDQASSLFPYSWTSSFLQRLIQSLG